MIYSRYTHTRCPAYTSNVEESKLGAWAVDAWTPLFTLHSSSIPPKHYYYIVDITLENEECLAVLWGGGRCTYELPIYAAAQCTVHSEVL